MFVGYLLNGSVLGNSPRDPDIPHRNFIPKETEPFVPITRPPAFDASRYLQSALALCRSNSTPPTEPAR
jgi:hypothetical protein